MSFSSSLESSSRAESFAPVQAKTIIVGDTTVGKSSIIWQYLAKDFKYNMPLTVGLDCNTKTIRLDDKNELKLLIWDTAGQEKYRCLISNYFKDSHGALIVFDLTVKESFEGIKKIWLENLSKNAPEKICKVVLANKCDKLEDIKVTDEEINEFEKEFNIKCFKTSAKDNIGIEESFEYLAHKMKETFFFMTSIENKNEMEYYFSNLDNKKKGIKIEKGKHNVQKSISSCCE